MSDMPPPDRMGPPPVPLQSSTTACDGCGDIFPLNQSVGDCPKCSKLSQHVLGSDAYKEIQKWPQCCKCGVTRHNMASATVEMVTWVGELNCGSRACTEGTPAEVGQGPRRPFGAGPPMIPHEHQPPVPSQSRHLVQNAMTETTQARIVAVRERLGKLPSRVGVNLGTLNTTQSLLHHEHGGGVPGEDKIWIGWQVRVNDAPKRINSDLGGGIKKHAMSCFMPDIKAEILATINVDWTRSYCNPVNPEETSFRWSGNRTLDPNTSNLSARDFYAYYNRPGEGNASIRSIDVPTFFKGAVRGQKGPKLFLEIYIDQNAWFRRTQEFSEDNLLSSMTNAQRKKRGRNDSTASIMPAKAKQSRGSGAASVFQSEFNGSASRANRTGILSTCTEVTMLKYSCITDVIKGTASVIGTGNTLVGSLNNKPFGRGSMKLAYDLYVNGGDHLVAKRFFRLDDFNIPADGEDAVPEDDDHHMAIECEGLRLAEGSWFLKEFYKYCSRPEYSDISVDKNIQFSTAFIGNEVSYPRSLASGKSDEMGKPMVWWLIEPKRPSTVVKFSGTLKHQTSRKDVLALTIYALAHYVYLTSKGTRVMADIQGTGTHINGKDTMVLFDVMMHSTTGDTGIGDFGVDGIESFLRDHACGLICQGLGLDKKKIAAHAGEMENELDNRGGEEDEEEQEEEGELVE